MQCKFKNLSLVKESEDISRLVVSDFSTQWTVACQVPLSMGFSRQEHWSGLPLPPSGYLPNTGLNLSSPAFQADSLLSEPPAKYFKKNTIDEILQDLCLHLDSIALKLVSPLTTEFSMDITCSL